MNDSVINILEVSSNLINKFDIDLKKDIKLGVISEWCLKIGVIQKFDQLSNE